jgi:hypothetical protein
VPGWCSESLISSKVYIIDESTVCMRLVLSSGKQSDSIHVENNATYSEHFRVLESFFGSLVCNEVLRAESPPILGLGL